MAGQEELVISTPAEVRGNNIIIKGRLDPQELRFSMLFWDKLDFPVNYSNVEIFLCPEGQFLADAGVLTRTQVEPSGVGFQDVARMQLDAHLSAFRLLDNKEPGVWSLATGQNSMSFDASDLEVKEEILFQLHRAIPVPDKDVPLQDILEFRTKRQAELMALRHYLEELYERAITAGDGPLALNREIEKLQAGIADHIKASREWGGRLRLAGFSAELNLVVPAVAAFTAYAAGLPVLDALLPAGAAALSLNVGAALKGHKATPTPFRYISSFHTELF